MMSTVPRGVAFWIMRSHRALWLYEYVALPEMDDLKAFSYGQEVAIDGVTKHPPWVRPC